MNSRRILSAANWTLGAYAALLLLGFTDLQDVKELIEVHRWQKCWQYSSFHTYVVSLSAVATYSVAAFLISWVLLKSTYWRIAAIVLGSAGLVAAVDFWWGLDCWQ
jgi:hypothetical protein